VVVCSAACVWVCGLGSVLAIVLFGAWRRSASSETDLLLMRIGFALGAAGLVATVVAMALLTGAQGG
jgi:hypothetical protein